MAIVAITLKVISRTDLTQGMPVPAYTAPFEAELGPQPTYEQMQVAVTRQKSRPLFPDCFKDTNPAIRSLKETITDCWDHDGDARLTALCVEERVSELPTLWDRYRSSLAATHSNLAPLMPLAAKNVLSLRNNASGVGGTSESISAPTVPCNANKVTNQMNAVRDVVTAPPVATAPVEKNQLAGVHVQPPGVTFPLQPYLQRNPCLERNLMRASPTDAPPTLLEHGLKFSNRPGDNSASWSDPTSDTRCLVRRNADSSEGAHTVRVSRPGPIPHTFNNALSTTFMPKQPNVGVGQRRPVDVEAGTQPGQTPTLIGRIRNWAKQQSLNRRRASDRAVNEESEPLSNHHQHMTTGSRNTQVSLQNGSANVRLLADDQASESTSPKNELD